MDEKIPPSDLEAEQSVLGSMMISKDAISISVHKVKSLYFYKDAHAKIFDVIVGLYKRSEPADLVTVSSELKKLDQLDLVGGRRYLMEIIDTVPTAANVEKYINIIIEKSMLRQLIDIGSHIVSWGFEPAQDVDQALEQSQRAIMDMSKDRVSDEFVKLDAVLKTVFDDIQNVYDNDDKIIGTSTGYPDLDAMTSGFQPSDLLILAARPAMGKTTLAMNFATNLAVKQKEAVAIFSLEMPKEQLAMRLLSSESKLDSKRLRTANLLEHEYKDLVQALGMLSEAPLYIDDTPSISPLDLRAKTRRLQLEADIKLIVIDYLQLMKSGRKRPEGRFQEVSEIVREIKAYAKESGIPIIALSQLSRDVEKRTGDDRRPRLSDLRESGEIEQTADLVLFIHRDDYYQQGADNDDLALSPTELVIAKHRNGPTGIVNLMFRKDNSQFLSADMS
ncbi:replicative DNA helicase [bacterium]|jgi:replicative DNA helicase|nr:replicative DNA helicase [bacterium]